MYTKKSENFIKIDSLQHLEISRQTYLTNLSNDTDPGFGFESTNNLQCA